MQNDPGRPWTVATLAASVGVSRALLARRFHELVGEPPMTFLTGWRMALAADLMVEPDATVTAVARAVGYGSPFTFSTAFKRAHGRSPRAYRDEQLPRRPPRWPPWRPPPAEVHSLAPSGDELRARDLRGLGRLGHRARSRNFHR